MMHRAGEGSGSRVAVLAVVLVVVEYLVKSCPGVSWLVLAAMDARVVHRGTENIHA